MDNLPPWTLYPSLTSDRLGIVARLIADVRHGAVLLHQPDAGDNNWSLGCRVYARTCRAIMEASQHYDWLTIIEDTGLHFVFALGGLPLRFYKGEPDKAPARSLRRNLPEIHAHQFSLFGEQASPRVDEILRIAVETDSNGEAERITLVQLVEDEGEGEVLNSWAIDFDSMPTVVPIEKIREGVALPPAKVLPFKTEEKKEEDEKA
jgi:hypothetical protein